MKNESKARSHKTEYSASNSFPAPEDTEYWHSRTPQERLENVERLRRLYYGKAAIGQMDKSIIKIVSIDYE